MTLDASTMARARLHPDESQRTFRVLVDALSQPGRLFRLPDAVLGRAPAALVPLLAIADIEVAVAVTPDPDGWADVLTVTTGAPVSETCDAEWVAFLDAPTPQQLQALDPGSAYAPERGTRIVVAVGSLDAIDGRRDAEPAAAVVVLRGPGVPGSRVLAVGGVDADVFAAVAAINADFPAGIDTWLVTADGTIAGLPRSTTIDVLRTRAPEGAR